MSRYAPEELQAWAQQVLDLGQDNLMVQILIIQMTLRTGLNRAQVWRGIHILAGRA